MLHLKVPHWAQWQRMSRWDMQAQVPYGRGHARKVDEIHSPHDWTPSKNTVICSLHFQSSIIVSRSADNNISRGLQHHDMVKKILKADAVPTVFSLLPSYFTKKMPPERSRMTKSSTRLEADNSRLQWANDQVLKVGHIKTLDELQLEIVGEIVPEGIHKILYQERLFYAWFSLNKQLGLRTVFSLAVSQGLSFDIRLGGKQLPSSAVSHLVTSGKNTDTCVIVNMLQIDALVDSLAVVIEEEFTLDERITGKLIFLIEQLRLATISPYRRR